MGLNMKKVLASLKIIVIVVVVILVGSYIWYENNYMVHKYDANNELKFQITNNKVLDSIGRGVSFLAANQSDDGAFISGMLSPSVEFTALSAQVLKNVPNDYIKLQSKALSDRIQQIIGNAIRYIKSNGPKTNGAIYTDLPGFSFSVYGTSISLCALRELGLAENDPLIIGAQKYLLSCQHLEKGLYQGGFSYGQNGRPDLNNTVNVLEALNASGLSKEDPAYKNVLEFVDKCQNRSENNNSGMAVTEDGGFYYKPDLTGKRADITLRGGRKAYSSYGAMSYAGLVSFLYADVDKSDPRVQSAWRWVNKNYDLNENIGKGKMGLYYYYRIMSKALAKYGERIITTPDGKKHDWAVELAETLIDLQNEDGSWSNTNKTFMENDKVLVTSYAVGTLEICYSEMKQAEESKK